MCLVCLEFLVHHLCKSKCRARHPFRYDRDVHPIRKDQVGLLVPSLLKIHMLADQEVLVVREVRGYHCCRIHNFGWGSEFRKGQVQQRKAFHMEIHMGLNHSC